MIRYILLLAVLPLAACATTKPEPTVRTVEIRVPVPVTCLPKGFPGPPAYPNPSAGRSAAEKVQLMGAELLLRRQRAAETEPVIAGCR